MEMEPKYSMNDIVYFTNEKGNYCCGVVIGIYNVGYCVVYDIEINDDYLGYVVKRGVDEKMMSVKK